MKRRLLKAHTLLKDTGVIIVAIGDDEHHRLRMLMDEIFGETNFISDVVWQGQKKSDARQVSNVADYMLIYARNYETLNASTPMWREAKSGTAEIREAGRRAWDESGHDAKEATRLLRLWWKSLPPDHPARVDGRATSNFKFVDDTCRPGEVFADASPSWPNGQGPRYDVIHPVTGKPCRVPKTGWRYTEETMRKHLSENRIYFGEDETSLPYYKRFLDESDSQVVSSVFEKGRRTGSQHLERVLGDKRFPFPKDHEVLMRWIGMIVPKDGIVLDFFAGSGSTGEAVMRLNAADGGTRQVILVTNNEVSAVEDKKLRKAGYAPGSETYEAAGVARHVTWPRLKTITTGSREDGSCYEKIVPGNVVFADLTYTSPRAVSAGLAFEAIAPLLWVKAGSRGPVIETIGESGWQIASHYAVLERTDAAAGFLRALDEVAPGEDFHVFVVADEDARYRAVASQLPAGVQVHRLYRSYLDAFRFTHA